MLTREAALDKLHELITNPALIHHCLCVEAVMRSACAVYGTPDDNVEVWALAGLLHDADWEMYPEDHPRITVEWLREIGETEIAYAVSAHFTQWGVPYLSQMDRALVACDELTGFVVACARVRPDGIATLEPKSVIKKLKQPKFAAGVSREEVAAGIRMLGCDLNKHLDLIITALRENADHLKLSESNL
jgi:putative nucleotidyltransferase with HDIG domain